MLADHCFPAETQSVSEKSVTRKNRRDILLEIAQLHGERNTVQNRLTWIEKQIAEKQTELKQFDSME